MTAGRTESDTHVPSATSALRMDFFGDLKRQAAAMLTAGGYDVPKDQPGHLSPILEALANVQRRLIPPAPRRVEWCPGLLGGLQDTPGLLAGVERLEVAFRRGDDLRPYQSKRVTNSATAEDLLFYDWWIHHFHLGLLQPGSRHCDRTGKLLFAWVEADRVLFMDVLDHDSFSKLALLELLREHWPDVLKPHIWSDIVLPARPSDSGIKTLRKGGITPIPTLSDGTVVFPPGAGLHAHTRQALHWRAQARWLEHLCWKHEAQVMAASTPKTEGTAGTVDLEVVLVDGVQVAIRLRGTDRWLHFPDEESAA